MAEGDLGRKYPSMVDDALKAPGMDAAWSNSAAGIARRAAREPAWTLSAKARPFFSPCSKGMGAKVGKIMAPLSPIAPAISSFDNGDAICADTAMEPAD